MEICLKSLTNIAFFLQRNNKLFLTKLLKNVVGFTIIFLKNEKLPGRKIDNPRFFKTDQKALAKAQRKLSKLEKENLLREKVRKVISRIYERITNRRNNFCHQITRKLVNCFGIICVEDLSINKMKENNFKSINRAIGDVAWGQFAQYLAYKAESAGRQLIRVNPAYTSQDCSRCGYRQVKKTF
jgi:putative transposase